MDIEESKSSCDLEQHEHEFYSQPESQMAYPKKMGEQNLEELKHQSEPSDSYSKSSTGIISIDHNLLQHFTSRLGNEIDRFVADITDTLRFIVPNNSLEVILETLGDK